MADNNQLSTFDLFDLWDVVWLKKKTIVAIVMTIASVTTLITLNLPNKYSAEVLVAPISEETNSGLASALSGLGGLASLAGVSAGGSGSMEQDLAVLSSREFLWRFIIDKNLMPIIFSDEWDAVSNSWKEPDIDKQPTLWDAYRVFTEEGVLSSSVNKKTGLVIISIEWTDPRTAAEWANVLVKRLNNHLKNQAIERSKSNLMYLHKELERNSVAEMRQTLFDLISKEQKSAMLANTQNEFSFRVIDNAIEPDQKSRPARALIIITSIIIAVFLSIFIVIFQQAFSNRKQLIEVSIRSNVSK